MDQRPGLAYDKLTEHEQRRNFGATAVLAAAVIALATIGGGDSDTVPPPIPDGYPNSFPQ